MILLLACAPVVEDFCADGSRWYPDADGDGYGDTTREPIVITCPRRDPKGRARWPDCMDYTYGEDCGAAYRDCDDTDAAIHPLATEVWYDGVDQDCDGRSDYDADRDYEDDASHGGADCEDMDSTISPEAPERCDGDDDDCDGAIDGPPCGTLAGRDDARVLTSETTWEAFTLDNVGDTDGDGADELLYSTFRLGTFVLSTFDTGSVHTAASAALQGDGTVVGGPAGDLDGDGLADLWAHELTGELTPTFILPGPLQGTHTMADEAWVLGAWRATAAGDLNGDGADDLVAETCVVFGPVERGTTVTSTCGGTVPELPVAAGDLDGDGMADLVIVGDPGYSEPVSVLHGPFDADRALDTAAGTWQRETEGWTLYDWSVVALGDVDGDGLDDLAIGDHGFEIEEERPFAIGSAYVVRGPADGVHTLADAWARVRGDPTGDTFGTSLAGPGDLDGDDRADLVVSGGDREVIDYGGSAWVITGLASGTWTAGTRAVRWSGAHRLGEDLAAGDLDGDGAREVALSVTTYDADGGDALWIVR